MKKPLVSVIIPVYNIEEFVARCLVSILDQSFIDYEVIIVDDGSTDGSGEVCDEFARKDKRVRVFHNKNMGLSGARNFGIQKAVSEMIALVDGDDFVDRDFIEKMYGAMVETDVDVVVCGYNGIRPRSRVVSGEEACAALLVKQENLEIVAWNKLYKKKLFTKNEIYYPVGEKHEDALTTYKLLFQANRVAYITESLYNYVSRDDSIMNKASVSDRLIMREKAAQEAVVYFKRDEELKDAAKIAVLTAKFALVDYGNKKMIDNGLMIDAIEWIRNNVKTYKDNGYMTPKLRLYCRLIMCFSGWGYLLFRKIIK